RERALAPAGGGSPPRPGVELVGDLLADPVDRRLGQRRLRAQRLAPAPPPRRARSKPRTKLASTNASNALVRLTPLPNSLEQNGSLVPRSLAARTPPGQRR